MKTLRLVLLFYKYFAFFSLLITGISVWLVNTNGWAAFSAVFWMKITTTGLIFWVVSGIKEKEFYYFQNLGLSRMRLWLYALGLDLGIFVLIFYFLP
jgi:hypothetical protein